MAAPSLNGRLQLGEGPGENIPEEWAPDIVRILWRDRRELVGAAIAEVVTGARYNIRRAPKGTSTGEADDGSGQ